MKAFRKLILISGCCVCLGMAFVAGFVPGHFPADVEAAEDGIAAATLLDYLLWPKAITQIIPLSQWGRRNLTTASLDPPPPTLLPVRSATDGAADPDTNVYYVMNSLGDAGAFGSNNGFNYWQGEADRYLGPLAANAAPYSVELPLDSFWADAPTTVTINALVGLTDIYTSVLSVESQSRIYYEVRTPAAQQITVETEQDAQADQTGSAVPDNIAGTLAPNSIWVGQSATRNVVGADLDFPDIDRVPGQMAGTARFLVLPGVATDLPTTTALGDEGILGPGERALGMIQAASSFEDLVDGTDKIVARAWANSPGDPLPGMPFMALHYFKASSDVLPVLMNPVRDITPLSAYLTVDAMAFEIPDKTENRLALWRFPLDLDAATGQYLLSADGAWRLAKAGAIDLDQDIFTASVQEDGIILPLVTSVWVDDAIPLVLAANSEKRLPVVLGGVFPTWMGTNPAEDGVTPAEADLNYVLTLDGLALEFRTPEIEGIAGAYAISPVTNVQEENRMFLLTPADLASAVSARIEVAYTDRDDKTHEKHTDVAILPTVVVSTEVRTNVTAEPSPAVVVLEPPQSAIETLTGEFPLEEGRFFGTELVTASLTDVAPGWGLWRWLRNGQPVGDEQRYAFVPGADDTMISAELASFALTLDILPDSAAGEILANPAPVAETPGYAPGAVVALTAQAATGNSFAGWMGPDARALAIQEPPTDASIVMNGDKSIAARFRSEEKVALVLLDSLNGRVEVRQNGNLVDPDIEEFDPNTVVTLDAINDEGYTFVAWDGPDAGDLLPDGVTSTVTLTLDTDKTVGAVFERDCETHTLTLMKTEGGSLEVVGETEAPMAVRDFPDRVELDYCIEDPPIAVTLVPRPDDEYAFLHWTDDATGNESPLVVEINAKKVIGAVFVTGRTLVTRVNMEEGGTVTPAGSTIHDHDTEVTVRATANPGYRFVRWVGDASGSQNPISVVMDRDKTVIAEFVRIWSLDVSVNDPEGGSVTLAPSQPAQGYDEGTRVTVTAVTNAGYRFMGWEGDDRVTAAILVEMDRDRTLTAVFMKQWTLTTAVNDAEAGTVTPMGSNGYIDGTDVLITAVANPGYRFLQWTGDASGGATSIVVAMDRNRTVTAVFVKVYPLSITVAPVVGGTVALSPAMPAWGGYDLNTMVTLIAVPAPGYRFVRWAGDLDSVDEEAQLLIDGPKNVRVEFKRSYVLKTPTPINGEVTISSTRPPDVDITDDDGLRRMYFDVREAQEPASPTMEAKPAPGYGLRSWIGDVAETERRWTTITFEMDQDRYIAADFAQLHTLVVEIPALGAIDVSPEPATEPVAGDGILTYTFFVDDVITLTAVADDPELHILNAWLVDGEVIDGLSPDFGAEYVFTVDAVSRVSAEFKRRLHIEKIDLEWIPDNRAVPFMLSGVFPTWMAEDAEEDGLSAEEAEARYEVLIDGTPASFVAPEDTSLIALGEGVSYLNEEDADAENAAYLWTVLLPDPAKAEEGGEVELVVRDRINPLNTATLTLSAMDLKRVVALTTEVTTIGAGIRALPAQSVISRGAEDDGLILDAGDYVVGQQVELTGSPRASFVKFRITVGDANPVEVTQNDYRLTMTEDTLVEGFFEREAYRLTLTPSEGGMIAATPPSSPGLLPGWYEFDAEVELKATSVNSYRFAFWTGDVQVAGQMDATVSLTMDGNKQVGAEFLPTNKVAVYIAKSQNGHIEITDPAGMVSTEPGLHIYNRDDRIRLEAVPNKGFRFEKWNIISDETEDGSANPLTSFLLDKDYRIEAVYAQTFKLDTTAIPEGGGTVILTPAQPRVGYDAGQVVTLEAKPNQLDGYRFVQWVGRNALDVKPNTTTAKVTLEMDADKALDAKFTKLAIAAIDPPEAWVFGGVVAKISGEGLSAGTTVFFGDTKATVFDASPSGQFAFVQVPPLAEDDADDLTPLVKVTLAIEDGGDRAVYQPSYTYIRRRYSDGIHTAAFIAAKEDEATAVFVDRIEERDARIVIPALGEAPVYGIVRLSLPGALAVGKAAEEGLVPGGAVAGLYDVGLHFYKAESSPALASQFGLMAYKEVTQDLMAFDRPYTINAAPTQAEATVLLSMAVASAAAPTVAQVRSGLSLWGVPTTYDYLVNKEVVRDAPYKAQYQSSLMAAEVRPRETVTTSGTDKITGLVQARLYGGVDAEGAANSFTWRSGAVLPVNLRQAVKLVAVDKKSVAGVGAGPVAGGTVLTLVSPHGGLGWISEIELASGQPGVGGVVLTRDVVSKRGDNEFKLEFRTPRSARPGKTDIVIRPAADPDTPIVLRNVFEYTRPPIRWWMVLLLLLGLGIAIVGIAVSET